MKKVIIILAVVFVAVSCKQAAKGNMVETTENGMVNIAGEEEGSPYNAILQQLSLTEEEVYSRLVSSQAVSANENLTIWVIPKISFLEKDDYGNEAFNLGRYVLLTDTQTGKIVSRSYVENAYASDAYELIAVNIDTLDYCLNDSRIMFGVSSSYRASTRVFPTGDSFIEVFVQQNDSLLSVFHYTTNSYHGENDGGLNGNSWIEEYDTKLFVAKNKTAGFSDFVLLTDYRLEATKNDELVKDSTSSDSIRFFRYVKNGYKEADKIEGTICREIKDGYGKRECYYLGKKMAEVYQIVYAENKDDLQKYMQPEMPLANLTYEIQYDEESEDNDVTVYYEYKTPTYLVIEVASEYGSSYAIFEEKEGYTIFRYDYHD